MDGQITLLICQVQSKKPEDYEKKYCHRQMHGKNYAIRDTMVVDKATCERLENGDLGEIGKLKEKVKDEGIEGEIIIQRALGGLGKRGKWESKGSWHGKRKAGMPEIARFVVD
jgi:hypothetical protein